MDSGGRWTNSCQSFGMAVLSFQCVIFTVCFLQEEAQFSSFMLGKENVAWVIPWLDVLCWTRDVALEGGGLG